MMYRLSPTREDLDYRTYGWMDGWTDRYEEETDGLRTKKQYSTCLAPKEEALGSDFRFWKDAILRFLRPSYVTYPSKDLPYNAWMPISLG
jgi:hypothetical protein